MTVQLINISKYICRHNSADGYGRVLDTDTGTEAVEGTHGSNW